MSLDQSRFAGTSTVSGYRLREERERYEREEAAAFDAKAKPFVDQQQQLLRQLAKEYREIVTQFWSRPLAKMYASHLGVRDPLASDGGINLPDRVTDRDVEAEKAALIQFYDTLTAKTGYTLSPGSGLERSTAFGTTQAMRAVKDLMTPEAWMTCFNRLLECDAFADGEIGYDESLKTHREPRPETPTKSISFDELLETTSAETREGRALLAEALMEQNIVAEFRPCWQAFTESLYRNFNGFLLTELQKKLFFEMMKRWNLNLNRPADYDKVRLAMAKNGDLPGHLIYEREKLAIEMEKADLSNLEVRREFVRRERQLNANQIR